MSDLINQFENDFDNIFTNKKDSKTSDQQDSVKNDIITGIMGILG